MKVNRAYLNYASLKVVLVVDPNRPTVNDASIVDMNELIADVLTPFAIDLHLFSAAILFAGLHFALIL